MKKKSESKAEADHGFLRYYPNPEEGLSSEQVDLRVKAGAVNTKPEHLTPSVTGIVIKNCITPFNLINLFLAVVIILVGHPENILFLGVVICNTAMGIFQELRAKKVLDELSVLAQTKVAVLRNGEKTSISQEEIVLDDIILISAGDQICADGVIVEASGLEIDESLLTGESNRIHKNKNEKVFSGSYVTSGKAKIRASAVGKDNYANSLTSDAQTYKKQKSKLLYVLNFIIQILIIIIIPLGLLLFYASYSRGGSIETSVLGSAAAMTGMIPGGLVLLTGVTMSVGAMNLAKKRALVQSLSSIETLARVDVLCLDKTGTITDGALIFEELVSLNDADQEQTGKAIAELMKALGDENATANCLREHFCQLSGWEAEKTVPFSSDRKWSGAAFKEEGSYILGAPGILFPESPELLEQVTELASEGYRVLCIAFSENPLEEQLPEELICHGLILLSDSIREDAIETFKYFADEGVLLKVISGDNPHTVSAVAKKAQINNSDKAIDMNAVGDDADYSEISEKYTVFGHVKPKQKQKLVKSLQENQHVVCMTGDGVNDILAMRESDCSVAMAGRSSAARNACDFVLLSTNFSAMKGVLREGRRVINNIERVAALYLVNTIYSILLTLIYTFIPFSYPYEPLQMTPVNALIVGIPSFFLALQQNYSKPKDKLMSNIFEHAVPAAITIVFNTLYLQAASILFELSIQEFSTMVVFMVGVVGFYLLFRIGKPYTRNIKIMLGCLITCFILLFTFAGYYFNLDTLFSRNVFFYMPLVYFSFHIHKFLGKFSNRSLKVYRIYKSTESDPF